LSKKLAVENLFRQPTQEPHPTLFEIPTRWEEHWWGMPSFSMIDARPAYRVTVNLYSLDDLIELGKRLGLKINPGTDSVTFPLETLDKPKDWVYCDE
jgi:hypothetical protein